MRTCSASGMPVMTAGSPASGYGQVGPGPALWLAAARNFFIIDCVLFRHEDLRSACAKLRRRLLVLASAVAERPQSGARATGGAESLLDGLGDHCNHGAGSRWLREKSSGSCCCCSAGLRAT